MFSPTAMIVRNKQGLMVGYIENKMFLKELYGSKHMLRKPIGWAIDQDIFDRVVSTQCYSVRIVDKETNRKYTAGVETFRKYAKLLDRKYNKQYVLELVHWNVS